MRSAKDYKILILDERVRIKRTENIYLEYKFSRGESLTAAAYWKASGRYICRSRINFLPQRHIDIRTKRTLQLSGNPDGFSSYGMRSGWSRAQHSRVESEIGRGDGDRRGGCRPGERRRGGVEPAAEIGDGVQQEVIRADSERIQREKGRPTVTGRKVTTKRRRATELRPWSSAPQHRARYPYVISHAHLDLVIVE
jgi:hypothetical protein